VAGIDAEQGPSIRIHEAFGFVQVAHLKQVGFKFGRWLDVIYLQLMLRE
jgi:phosphinothricin acetyltransferase